MGTHDGLIVDLRAFVHANESSTTSIASAFSACAAKSASRPACSAYELTTSSRRDAGSASYVA